MGRLHYRKRLSKWSVKAPTFHPLGQGLRSVVTTYPLLCGLCSCDDAPQGSLQTTRMLSFGCNSELQDSSNFHRPLVKPIALIAALVLGGCSVPLSCTPWKEFNVGVSTRGTKSDV